MHRSIGPTTASSITACFTNTRKIATQTREWISFPIVISRTAKLELNIKWGFWSFERVQTSVGRKAFLSLKHGFLCYVLPTAATLRSLSWLLNVPLDFRPVLPSNESVNAFNDNRLNWWISTRRILLTENHRLCSVSSGPASCTSKWVWWRHNAYNVTCACLFSLVFVVECSPGRELTVHDCKLFRWIQLQNIKQEEWRELKKMKLIVHRWIIE